MRKFSLMAVATALFSTGVYAQTQCQDSPNNPSIGTEYEYIVNVTPTTLTGAVYKWYVTQEANLLTGAVLADDDKFKVANTGSSAYNSDANTTNTLKLTWKPDALGTQPYYLVVKYKGNNGTCDVSNMKAMKIMPLNNFKLTIEPVNANGTNTPSVCAADISEATIVGDNVKYVYGETTLYYKVTTSGYRGSWKPTINLPALQGKDNANGGRKYKSIQWERETAGTFVDFQTGFTASGEEQQNMLATDATERNEFLLKVVIENGTHEGLTAEGVRLATKGQMVLKNNTLGARDVNDNCQPLNDTDNKNATQTILERPTITAQAGTFITQLQ